MTKKHAVRSREPKSHLYEYALLTAFFFSGATSLSLEVAWSKELTYLLGVDIYAAATVITAFMAGLGLGALLVARCGAWIQASVWTYGLLQLIIGFCALFSIPLFRSTRPLFSLLFNRFGYDSGEFLLIRFLVVFGLMLIPVTLMGMTLPVVVGASYNKVKGRYAYLTGRLYGVNTLGAVFGTIIAGFLLIPNLGILKTCLATGSVDLLIGCAILLSARYVTMKETTVPLSYKRRPVQELPVSGQPTDLPVSFAATFSWPAFVFLLSGISALAYEIIWFRLLARIIGPSVHAFSIMLAVYLLGIASGSLMGSGIEKKIKDHRLAMSVILGTIGLGALASLFFINKLPIWYGMLFIRFTSTDFTIRNLVLQGVTACILILPATVPLGAFFPIVTRAYNSERKSGNVHEKDSVGYLYFYNTVGGIIGSLGAGFWLVPAVGIKSAVLSAGGLCIAIASAIYFTGIHSTWFKKAVVGCVTLCVFSLIIFASPGMNQTLLNAGLYSEMVNKQYFSRSMIPENRNLGTLVYFKEGINNSVAVVANRFNDGNLTLHLSGDSEASTEIHGRLHLKFLGHLPMLFAGKAKTVGVIGLGAGITTGAVLLYPDVRQVNVFELEPGVINAGKYFTFVNNAPLEDSRTRLFMVDGRSHITYGNTMYDVITSDPIHPYMAGASNLYTSDYYKIMAGRLNPGGIFCQWIPFAGMSTESYNTVLNSMRLAFPHIAVFSFFGESVIIASREPLKADWKTLEKKFYDPKVHADLRMLDVNTPYNLILFFMGAEAQIDGYLSGFTKINTDDNVWLEHRIPMDLVNSKKESLFHILQEKIPADGRKSIEQIFSGIPKEKIDEELAALKKDGDNYYRLAQEAHKLKDYKSMEKFLRMTMADFNSVNIYSAGTQLMDHLYETGRIDDIFPVASFLQRNFPAFPEAYVVEARAWEKKGEKRNAEQALNRGFVYLPDNPLLILWRRNFGIS